MLRGSFICDFNISTWHISNNEDIFIGTCFESEVGPDSRQVSATIGKVVVWSEYTWAFPQ